MDFRRLENTNRREEELGASQSHLMLDNYYKAEGPIIHSYAENRGCLTEVCHRSQGTPADMTYSPHGDDVSCLPAERPSYTISIY